MGIPCTFSRLAITELNVPFQCLRSDLSPVLGLPATDTAKLKAVVLPVVLSPDTCINKDFKSGLNCLRKESTGELKPNITANSSAELPSTHVSYISIHSSICPSGDREYLSWKTWIDSSIGYVE